MRAVRPLVQRRSRSGARTALRGPLLFAVVVILAVLGVLGVLWYRGAGGLGRVISQGLKALDGADTPQKIQAALDGWERATQDRWAGRADALIDYLYTKQPLKDPRVRLLLTRVSGSYFGDRLDDWKRWYKARADVRAGRQPELPRGENLRLESLWPAPAPIGLTAWFTTIIPIDGQIYVASLGASFDDLQDEADGIVRVDGASGAAEIMFTPPDRGPRDIIGIAAGDQCLFATCANGHVYCVERNGKLRWRSQQLGAPLSSAPLAIDFDHDKTTDVIVVTTTGNVVGLSGTQGRPVWSHQLQGAAAALGRAGERNALGATLAVGNVLPGGGADIVVCVPTGEVEVLSAASGKSLWRYRLDGGTWSGALCTADATGSRPPVYAGDRAARIWSLARSGKGLEAFLTGLLATRPGETLRAALRTYDTHRDGPPLLIACPTGGYGGSDGAICAVGTQDVEWRLNLGGSIWGTPAVADLNGDRKLELVAASIETVAQDKAIGVLNIISADGHLLRRIPLPAPIECSPVVSDVNGDNRLDVLVADQSGMLHCFTTGGSGDRRGAVQWGLLGGDSHNTRNAVNAYAYGQLLYGYQWQRPE